MREQVCLYMCPWPRIQAALTDEYALNVTYRHDRGEPRGSAKKNALLRAKGEPAGDCVDCLQCVNVCPTGVDIREGANLGCIQCGLCIDACDTVMTRVGHPTALIAYDTEINIQRRQHGEKPVFKLFRARTVVYAAIIAVVAGVMLYTFLTRQVSGLAVIHDRNPIYVRLADGSIRNAYTMRIINKTLEPRTFRLTMHAQGLTIASLMLVDEADGAAGYHEIYIGPDQTREVRALVTSYENSLPRPSVPVLFTITDTVTGIRATATDNFRGPETRP